MIIQYHGFSRTERFRNVRSLITFQYNAFKAERGEILLILADYSEDHIQHVPQAELAL